MSRLAILLVLLAFVDRVTANKTCSLCDESEQISNPGLVLFFSDDGRSVTCDELQTAALTGALGEECADFSSVYAVACGCTDVPEAKQFESSESRVRAPDDTTADLPDVKKTKKPKESPKSKMSKSKPTIKSKSSDKSKTKSKKGIDNEDQIDLEMDDIPQVDGGTNGIKEKSSKKSKGKKRDRRGLRHLSRQ